MAHPPRAVLSSTVATAAALLLLAQPGSAAVRGAPVRVTPAVGGPATIFAVSFVSPLRTGVVGSARLRTTVSATRASPRKGCLSEVDATAPPTARGRRLVVRLDPARRGGRWCAGVYHGTVLTLQTAVCRPGEVCPQYMAVRARVGRFTLRVRPGA